MSVYIPTEEYCLERKEVVYIITSQSYATKGYYKVTRTKGLGASDRMPHPNNVLPPGDGLFVAAEINTSDAEHLEEWAHDTMKSRRVADTSEWYHVPYLTVYKILTRLTDAVNKKRELVNEVIREAHRMERAHPNVVKRVKELPAHVLDALDLSTRAADK